MFKRIIYSNILSITKKGLKISIIEIFKGFILIIIKNIEYKDFKIGLMRKELLLNIYHHIY